MKRIFTYITVVLLSTSLFEGSAKATENLIHINYNIHVVDNILYLNDIFEGVQKYGDIEVDVTPEPGKTKVYSKSYIQHLMSQYDLLNKGITVPEKIYVHRASQIVNQEMIEELIKDKLQPYWKQSLEIVFDLEPLEFHIASNAKIPLRIQDIRYIPETGRFQSIVQFAGDTESSYFKRIDGSLTETIRVYVPARPIVRGEVIRKEALHMKKLPVSKLMNNTIVSVDDLVGMSSKKSLGVNQLIRSNDIDYPKIVFKGSLLNIIYKAHGIKLSLKGRALEEGVKGQTIRVQNLDSHTTIYAKVISPSEALIIN